MARTWPKRVGTLEQCPRCGECCFAVMVRYDGSLYLARHHSGKYSLGRGIPCYGPLSAELIDLLIVQHGLMDDGSAGAR
jgi:hypothetical protein